jgi:hypothetical protein
MGERPSTKVPNGTVQWATANDFPIPNRAARGSVCNGLFGSFRVLASNDFTSKHARSQNRIRDRNFATVAQGNRILGTI